MSYWTHSSWCWYNVLHTSVPKYFLGTGRAVIQVKQSNSKCRVWPLLPYSNRVRLDKKWSNNPERVSINLGTWPMSNEALIAYYLISKQHFNHAKTRVQFDLTIRIVNTREGLQISGVGLGRTRKIIEIKISSLQVFSYQQLLHAIFFSIVSISSCACPNLRNHNCLHKNSPWREFILSLVFFTVYVLSGFPFKPATRWTNKQTFRSNQTGAFSPGPSSGYRYTLTIPLCLVFREMKSQSDLWWSRPACYRIRWSWCLHSL